MKNIFTFKSKLFAQTIFYLFVATAIFPQWSTDSLMNICANDAVSTFRTKTMFVNPGNWELYDVKTRNSTSGLLSLGRNAIKVATVKSVAYFGGGQYGPYTDPVYTKNIDVYDFKTNTWTLKKLSKAREVGAAAAVGSKILFAGGRDALNMYNTVDIFDVSAGTVSVAKLSKARTNIAVGVNGSKVVFAGGWYFDFSYNRPTSDAVDIYDATTGSWTTARLSQKRQEISVASVGTKIVFAGGLPNSGASNKVDIYDVSTNTWSTATLSAQRYGMTVNVIGTKAYFASGAGAPGKIDVYDAVSNTWAVINMPYNLVSAAGAVINGNLFYAGGYDALNYAVSNVVQIYNTATKTWSTNFLSQARAGSNVISIDSITLFAGGFTKVTYPSVGSTRIDIYTLSSVVSHKAGSFDFSISPNPIINEMQISMASEALLPVSLSVHTENGNLIAMYKVEGQKVFLQMKNIPPGRYILSARDASGACVNKIILKQ